MDEEKEAEKIRRMALFENGGVASSIPVRCSSDSEHSSD